MLRTLFLTPILLLFAVYSLHAQTYTITGRLIDAADNSALIAADVQLISAADSTKKQGMSADSAGRFTFTNLNKGTYILKFSFLGYKTVVMKLTTSQAIINIGNIKLSSGGISLPEAKVQGHQIRAEQVGDTIQYHADAFKVNPDATTEDLVTKMPGIVVNSSGVQAHGETVQQVLVDGKPFFGDDPTAALRNLPAEVVDKVQVYDQMSDQSKFTGFDDGNSQKTINIITKKDKRKGEFGKFTGGYGDGTSADGKALNTADQKYLGSGNFNIFNGDERLSILGLTNNINQQNFSSQDLLGVMGSSSQRGGGGRAGPSLITNPGYSGGGSSNFLVGQQGGINTTTSGGLNFSDSIAHRIYFTASYFGNKVTNTTNSGLTRSFFTPQQYTEQDNSTSPNLNNRINLRFDCKLDSMNSLLFTPKISTQANMLTSSSVGQTDTPTVTPESKILNKTNNQYYSNSTGYNLNANLLFRHKFNKPGRTFSWNVGATITNKNSDDTLHSTSYYRSKYENRTILAPDSMSPINQNTIAPSPSYTFTSNLAYTESLTKTSQLLINYNPTYSINDLNKLTYNQNISNREYNLLDTTLSNKYDYNTFTNKAGVSLRQKWTKAYLMLSLNAQNENLTGNETFPSSFSGTKSYNSLLPMIMYNYKFNEASNMRLMYTTSTQVPGITQLQSVINNSNPLSLSTGNPSLDQSYNNTLTVRYAYTNPKTAQSIFYFASISNTLNYIGNSTSLLNKDSILPKEYNDFRLPKGAQFTVPVNLQGYWSARTFITYGLPFDIIKSNLNLNGGVSYSSTPGLVNNVMNFSNTYNFNPGFVLSSNISPKLDNTLSYSPSYNIVKNTVVPQENSDYFSQTITFKFNWIFYKGFTFYNELDHTLYTGLAAYNENFLIWDMSVGKKFLKNQAGELKLYAFDILGENKSISRTVTSTYIDDMNTQVLTRYVMLSFTYTLRNFHGIPMPTEDQDQRRHFFHPPGGGPPPGGDGGGGQ